MITIEREKRIIRCEKFSPPWGVSCLPTPLPVIERIHGWFLKSGGIIECTLRIGTMTAISAIRAQSLWCLAQSPAIRVLGLTRVLA
jgi:hypothetical protein